MNDMIDRLREAADRLGAIDVPGWRRDEHGRMAADGWAVTELLEALSGPLADVRAERARQDEKWGEQNHPDGTGEDSLVLLGAWINIPGRDTDGLEDYGAAEIAAAATRATNSAADSGKVTWADILLEEVFEALAESDPVSLRKELVQVAAVATQWVEAIDRRDEVSRG